MTSKEERLRKVAEIIDPGEWRGDHPNAWGRETSLAKASEIEAEYAEEIGRLRADKDRLDWLEMRVVKVADALVYGSRHLFFASPDDSYEGEIGPSDLRAKVDEALALSTVVGETE